jgi:hypothetical protein
VSAINYISLDARAAIRSAFYSLTKYLRQPADRFTSGRNVGTHAQMMAQVTSAMDHTTVFCIVHVGSPLKVEARSVVRRIIEIAHVLIKRKIP